jgi:hypothetical protein
MDAINNQNDLLLFLMRNRDDEELIWGNLEQIVRKSIEFEILEQIKYNFKFYLESYFIEHPIEFVNYYEFHVEKRTRWDNREKSPIFEALIENNDYVNGKRLYNASDKDKYMLIDIYCRNKEFNTNRLLFDNMEFTNFEKIKQSLCLLDFRYNDKEPVIPYIENIFQEIQINEIYDDILPWIFDLAFKQHNADQRIFAVIHQYININNDKLTKYLLDHIESVIIHYQSLQQHGYDFIPNKNKFLDKIINRMQKSESINIIRYLIENDAIPKKMERKKYKTDDQVIVNYLTEHGIRSV